MATDSTVTVKSTGGDYSSLNAAIADWAGQTDGDLVTADVRAIIDCYNFEDGTPVNVGAQAWTTNFAAGQYLWVRAVDDHPAAGWSTSVYRLNASSGSLSVVRPDGLDDFVFEGIQVRYSGSSGTYVFEPRNATGVGWVKRGVFIQESTSTSSPHNVQSGTSALGLRMVNCLLVSSDPGTGANLRMGNTAGSVTYLYGCTLDGAHYGVYPTSVGFVVARGTRITNAASSPWFGGDPNTGSDYNLTDAASGPTNWGANSITSATVAYVDGSNSTLTARDYTLDTGDDGIDAGVDLSAAQVIFSEGAEGTGYEETWSQGEAIGTGCSIDEDYATSSVTGAPAGWGDSCIRLDMKQGQSCLVEHRFGADLDVAKVGAEFIVTSESLANGQDTVVWELRTTGSVSIMKSMVDQDSSGNLRLETWVYYDGSAATGYYNSISLDTPFRVDILVDQVNGTLEWFFDNSSQASGAMTGSLLGNGLGRVRIGDDGGETDADLLVHIDNVTVTDYSAQFTDDITGTTRTGTWDIGASEISSASPLTLTPDVAAALAAALDPDLLPGLALLTPDQVAALAAALDVEFLPGLAYLAPDPVVATATALDVDIYSATLLVPVGDIATNGWTDQDGNTPVWPALDETTPNDADFARSPGDTSNAVLEVALESAVDPTTSENHRVHYRIAKEGAGTLNLTVALVQGTTVITSWLHSGVGSDVTEFTQVLSGAQADAITDYGDLRLRFTPEVV